MILTRHNPLGLTFTLSPEQTKAGGTRITTRDKSIVVPVDIDTLSSCWFAWQMMGEKIQHAFPMLTAAQREFLLTAITPDEWDAMFPEDDDNPLMNALFPKAEEK